MFANSGGDRSGSPIIIWRSSAKVSLADNVPRELVARHSYQGPEDHGAGIARRHRSHREHTSHSSYRPETNRPARKPSVGRYVSAVPVHLWSQCSPVPAALRRCACVDVHSGMKKSGIVLAGRGGAFEMAPDMHSSFPYATHPPMYRTRTHRAPSCSLRMTLQHVHTQCQREAEESEKALRGVVPASQDLGPNRQGSQPPPENRRQPCQTTCAITRQGQSQGQRRRCGHGCASRGVPT